MSASARAEELFFIPRPSSVDAMQRCQIFSLEMRVDLEIRFLLFHFNVKFFFTDIDNICVVL